MEKEMATHSGNLAWRIQYRGALQATVHEIAKSQTRLGDLTTSAFSYGEGDGTPLKYSYLENAMDGEAW